MPASVANAAVQVDTQPEPVLPEAPIIDLVGSILRSTIPTRLVSNNDMTYFSIKLDIRYPGELFNDATHAHRDHPNPAICAMKSLSYRYERYDIMCSNVAHFVKHHPVWIGANAFHIFLIAPTELLIELWADDKYGDMFRGCMMFEQDFLTRADSDSQIVSVPLEDHLASFIGLE